MAKLFWASLEKSFVLAVVLSTFEAIIFVIVTLGGLGEFESVCVICASCASCGFGHVCLS